MENRKDCLQKVEKTGNKGSSKGGTSGLDILFANSLSATQI